MHSHDDPNSNEASELDSRNEFLEDVARLESLVQTVQQTFDISIRPYQAYYYGYHDARPLPPSNESLQKHLLPQQVKLQLALIEKLLELKKCIDSLENKEDPLFLSQIPENIRPRLPQFIFLTRQLLKDTFTGMNEGAYLDLPPKERVEYLQLIFTGIDKTVGIIKGKFQDPEPTNDLLKHIKLIKRNKITQYFLDRPFGTVILGGFIAMGGISLIITGALLSAFPGGLVVGGPMISAGAALIPIGMRLCKLGGGGLGENLRDEELPFFKKTLTLAKLGDQLEKVVNSQKTQSTFAACDKAIQACRAFLNKPKNARAPANDAAIEMAPPVPRRM